MLSAISEAFGCRTDHCVRYDTGHYCLHLNYFAVGYFACMMISDLPVLVDRLCRRLDSSGMSHQHETNKEWVVSRSRQLYVENKNILVLK